MSIIICAKNCKHQADGYCMLENTSLVTNTKGGCPFYQSSKDLHRVPQGTHADEFNAPQ